MRGSRWSICIVVAIAFACTGERQQRRASASQPAPPIILISIDTLRSDHLPAYGYTKVETPAIDALRRDSVLFTYAYSHCPMTLPSHLSMLTGLIPPDHGVRNNLGYRFDATAHLSIPVWLKERGYRTGAAVSSSVLRGETGMAAMFDDYDDAIPAGNEGVDSGHQRKGSIAAKAALKWIEAHRERPFFYMLHLYEPHAPYEPPEPYRSRFASRYDGEIATADAIVGDFMAALRRDGIYDRAMIILTSDHGEGLMDHGEDQHGILLYREAIQVPLILKLPDGTRRGSSVQRAVQLIDLFPTIVDVAGASPLPLKGRSLLSDDPRAETVYSETLYPRIHLGWSELRSEVDGQFHYIESPRPELFDVRTDPAEKSDIGPSQRRASAAMRDALASIPSGIGDLKRIEPEEAAALASLGYLGRVSSASTTGPLPNPRDEVRSLEAVKAAFLLADQRRYNEAIPRLQTELAKNPRLVDARERLGESLIAVGRYDDAIATYRQALATAERFSPDMALSLARAQLLAGKTADARKSAAVAMASNPMRAHEMVARSALAEGRIDEAAQEAALANAGRNPQPTVMLLNAEVLRARGDLQGALAAVDAAAAQARTLEVKNVYGLHFLRGDLLARMNRPQDAEAEYRQEIGAFPGNLQAWVHLAVIYRVENRTADIDRLLRQMVKENPQPAARSAAIEALHNLELPELERTWKLGGGN